MISWLLVAEHVSRAKRPLSALVAEMRAGFPFSGEIDFRLPDPEAALARVEAARGPGAEVDRLDGLSLAHADWRANLRKSDTEPVLRLNVETRGDAAPLAAKVADLRALILARAGDANGAGAWRARPEPAQRAPSENRSKASAGAPGSAVSVT